MLLLMKAHSKRGGRDIQESAEVFHWNVLYKNNFCCLDVPFPFDLWRANSYSFMVYFIISYHNSMHNVHILMSCWRSYIFKSIQMINEEGSLFRNTSPVLLCCQYSTVQWFTNNHLNQQIHWRAFIHDFLHELWEGSVFFFVTSLFYSILF